MRPSPPGPGEPIIALRGWLPLSDALKGTGVDYTWPQREILAVHFQAGQMIVNHSAPTQSCTCGIYGYSTLHAALRSSYSSRDNAILGCVLLWGRICAAPLTQGDGYRYRAEYARILALEEVARAERPAERYGVPLVRQEHLELYAKEHGIAMPARWLPDREISA